MNKNIVCLLIEDDQDDQEIFSLALKDVAQDITFRVANSGVDALDKLHAGTLPDYIFMDVNMPKMNGIECLAKFREQDIVNRSRVYMISTSADPRLVEKCRSLGAKDFIVKPNTIGELVTTLENIFIRPAQV